ncbi:MAG TPA: ABC transporter ATP-binding protein [Bryobacteraceae bacterium]|jgi:lipopolysaccharide transport system ATP-binding protein|nr:ABC transporter ATP-binding protein [Bryobacteraceae bacterium]
MTPHAIRVRKLSKRYTLGESRPYRRLRHAPRGCGGPNGDTIWALEDVDFEVRRGEVVGVIGHNGAGKSTLLKVLARITEPTSGWADIYGRVGTLLEVGTGFHNELTGRENIFLNGAILGMKRAEIQRQFDAIVAFAEVEKFIDTPVKHYSSGMYLKLAFAVAAHLEPEILFVDEVLAVGDLAFQQKCLGKMGDVARQGRTILFVSHNMGAVRSLCTTGIVLDRGRVAHAGDITSSIECYHRLTAAREQRAPAERQTAAGSFSAVTLSSHGGSTVRQGEEIEAATVLQLESAVPGFTLQCVLEDMHQRRIFTVRRESAQLGEQRRWRGAYAIRVRIPAVWLEPGLYSLYFEAALPAAAGGQRYVSDVFHLDVGGRSAGANAVLAPDVAWSLDEVSRAAGQEAQSA